MGIFELLDFALLQFYANGYPGSSDEQLTIGIIFFSCSPQSIYSPKKTVLVRPQNFIILLEGTGLTAAFCKPFEDVNNTRVGRRHYFRFLSTHQLKARIIPAERVLVLL